MGNKLPITIAILLAVSMMIHSPTISADTEGKPASIKNKAASNKFKGSVLGDAKFVFQQATKSVVIVKAYSTSEQIQGSGVAFHYGYNTPEDFVNSKPSHTSVTTNAHVIKDSTKVLVFQKDKSYPAIVEYIDSDLDLAILRVDGIALAISMPNKGSQIEVGEKAFAIGSPLGLENSITEGIISGKRELNGILLLQTTAPISKGNSGGGLFDNKARFIGITTFKLTSGENINFAVDADYVSEIQAALFQSEILRLIAETVVFSPDEIALVKSHRLTKWLLNERAENGQKFYIAMKKYSDDYIKNFKSPDSLQKIKSQYGNVLRQFLHDMGTQKPNLAQNNSETLQLICRVSDSSGSQADMIVKLDYKNKTANGFPAYITDAEVWWEDDSRGKTAKYTAHLNRYSGLIVISTETFPNLASGQCQRVTERQF